MQEVFEKIIEKLEHDGCKGCKYEKRSADSKECQGCKQNAVDKYTRMTNADRIRSMSDEELEEFMQKAVFCGVLIGREESSKECRGCKLPFCCADRKYMKWLQSEVEE